MIPDQAASQHFGSKACAYAGGPTSRPEHPVVCCLPSPVRMTRPSRKPAHRYGPKSIRVLLFFSLLVTFILYEVQLDYVKDDNNSNKKEINEYVQNTGAPSSLLAHIVR